MQNATTTTLAAVNATIPTLAKLDPLASHIAAINADTTVTAKPAPKLPALNKAAKASKAAKAAIAKPAAKAVAVKPAEPSAADIKRASDFDARVALIGELRTAVAKLYSGPSLAIRSNTKRIAATVYAALLASPNHRTTLAKLSVRDESALTAIIAHGDSGACFDPSAINLDSGIFSRLCSVAFIESAPQSSKLPFRLSKAGAEYSRILTKRAA